MKQHKKTFVGSMAAFLVGTSCCWLSFIIFWLGGVTFLTALVKWIEHFQPVLILFGVVLLILSVYLYWNDSHRSGH